jgi:cell division protein FtsI (penicillin-binding protein 3)
MNEFAFSSAKRVRKRTIILAFFFFLWFFGLTLRLIELQLIEHGRLREAVIQQNQSQRPIYPERAKILDRHGRVLARSVPAPSVALIPGEQKSRAEEYAKVGRLKTILELSDRELQKIKVRIEHRDPFIYIKRKISEALADQVKRLDLDGIDFQEENKRFYPLGTLAAHVLGGVGTDNEGLSGLERQYDARLAGVEGRMLMLHDAKRRTYHWEVLKEPAPGQDIILTIDEFIQYIAESELEKAVRESRADWGTVIISHPLSGEILAMASLPTYDPNTYPPFPLENSRNRATQQNFEPGSTFKIVTAAAAREFGVVDFADNFDCREGKIKVAGWTISDHKKLGVLSFSEVIIESSNVGAIKVGQRVGAENLYRMIRAFHVGEKTGIELPGEENGILRPLQKWSGTSLAAHSIGYEISVTGLQILQAMNIIANQGLLVPPRVTREFRDSAGFAPAAASSAARIISEKTARELIVKVFEKVVIEGTGQAAQVSGFTVAGKTGTAKKIDPATGAYSAHRHLASFVGFVPASNPLLSILVVIDEPDTSEDYGGQVAAPIFREIARRVLLYLRQTPEYDPAKKIVTAQARGQD